MKRPSVPGLPEDREVERLGEGTEIPSGSPSLGSMVAALPSRSRDFPQLGQKRLDSVSGVSHEGQRFIFHSVQADTLAAIRTGYTIEGVHTTDTVIFSTQENLQLFPTLFD